MLYIVGVSGKAGSGKDTLVAYMRGVLEESGINSVQVAFAKGVKDFGVKYFGEICDPVKKDPVSRSVLQGIGQMMRQEVGSEFWVQQAQKAATKAYGKHKDEDFVVFITDVRYKNEANSLMSNTAFNTKEYPETRYLVRLEGRTTLEGEAAEHPSEIDLDDYTKFNYIYSNRSTLEDLYDFGRHILKEIIDEPRQ